jgi:hypothetical protein
MTPERRLSCAKGWLQLFYAECEMDHIWPDMNLRMMASTGRREPISMSGAGKAVCGILRLRPCSFLAAELPDPAPAQRFRPNASRVLAGW